MITIPTVFVLGAGASQHLQFPVGIELAEHVKNVIPTTPQFVSLRDDGGFGEDEIKAFVGAFSQSGFTSVDAFLEARPKFTEIGKAAIAYHLIPYEQDGFLFNFKRSWLIYLYAQMNAPFERFAENAVSFITFNYDRSVEHFLMTCLVNSHGKSENEAAAVLKHIPVIHLHGRLGYLPWQNDSNNRPYWPIVNKVTLKTAIQGIKIVHEDVADRDDDFKLAHAALHNAKQIFFLCLGTTRSTLTA